MMEVKVWMDGYQRIVCGVTEQTTCQDLMVALAQAAGMTGRYAMFEKWRNTEHSLSPAEYPLLVLQKWGDYSNDVQLILRHSGPADPRRKIHPIQARRLEGGPPERVSLKKSLTFSGVHRRAHSVDRSTDSRVRIEDCARHLGHSVESSEQSSIASQSSASLSPFTSLERQSLEHRSLEHQSLERQSLEHRSLERQSLQHQSLEHRSLEHQSLQHQSLERQSLEHQSLEHRSLERQSTHRNGHGFAFDNLNRERLTSTESKRTSRAERFSQVSKEAEAIVLSQQMQHTVTNVDFQTVRSSTRPQPPTPASRPAGGGVGGVVKSHIPKPNQVVGKELLFNGAKRVSANGSTSEVSLSKSGNTAVSQQSPKISSANASNSPHSSTAMIHSHVHFKQKLDAKDNNTSGKNLVIDASSSQKAPISMSPLLKLAAISNSTENKGKNATKDIGNTPVHDSEIQGLGHREVYDHLDPPIPTKRYQLSENLKVYPLSRFPTTLLDTSSGSPSLLHSMSDESNSSGSSESSNQLTISGDESLKEEKERKELIELIGGQEQELWKCESRLRELNCEILLLEGDSKVDGKRLESQLKEIEELEALEKAMENELEELELVSWEEKLEMERQRENRLQAEVLLLQSNIEKSETEIQMSVLKIKGLTSKTEDANKELNQLLKEKQEKEEKEMVEWMNDLLQAEMESQDLEKALESVEQEIGSADNCLSKRKDDFAELECQLKRLNLDLFLNQPTQVESSRKGRSSLVDGLGLSRLGSSRRLQWSHLTHAIPHRLNSAVDETRNHSYGHIV